MYRDGCVGVHLRQGISIGGGKYGSSKIDQHRREPQKPITPLIMYRSLLVHASYTDCRTNFHLAGESGLNLQKWGVGKIVKSQTCGSPSGIWDPAVVLVGLLPLGSVVCRSNDTQSFDS